MTTIPNDYVIAKRFESIPKDYIDSMVDKYGLMYGYPDISDFKGIKLMKRWIYNFWIYGEGSDPK